MQKMNKAPGLAVNQMMMGSLQWCALNAGGFIASYGMDCDHYPLSNIIVHDQPALTLFNHHYYQLGTGKWKPFM